eukprot:4091049-Alexandrium_andersonii.AAC.1
MLFTYLVRTCAWSRVFNSCRTSMRMVFAASKNCALTLPTCVHAAGRTLRAPCFPSPALQAKRQLGVRLGLTQGPRGVNGLQLPAWAP